MRIGIFGGSFDPVHKEHIALAREAVRSLCLDKLIVVPAAAPPHKPGKRLSPDEDRLQMCRIAFAQVANTEVSGYETERGGTSYTYLTCRHFKELYPQAELFWLVGTDMLRDFPTWKNTQDILQNVTLAVCARAEQSGWLQREQTAFFSRFGKQFAVVDYHGADVSSTHIRVLAAAGEDVAAYVGEEVQKYIKQRGMYAMNGVKAALELQKSPRKAHTLRVAETAAKRATSLGIDERQAIQAALLHDCGKHLDEADARLTGFVLVPDWGEVPPHQYTGAYVAEHVLGVTDSEVLDAIRYHTSGRADMTVLGALIFLADMVEDGRNYDGVDVLRTMYWQETPKSASKSLLFACLEEALRRTIEYLEEKGEKVYPMTKRAYAFYKDQHKENGYE